jgi:hypothetical protein
MNKILITVLGLMVGTAGLALSQSPAQATDQSMGRGRGGAPFAWNDKNKDGICDVTNKPIGSNGIGARGRGRGRAAAWGMGRGFGRGYGRGMGSGYGVQQQQQPAPAQPQK